MIHSIPEDTLNSNIEYCIDEYVRKIEHRTMLREWWFADNTLEELSVKHNISVTKVKSVIYGIGDKILIRASNMGDIKKP